MPHHSQHAPASTETLRKEVEEKREDKRKRVKRGVERKRRRIQETLYKTRVQSFYSCEEVVCNEILS